MPDPARAAAARNYLASIGVQVPTRVRRRAPDVPGTIPGLAEAYATPAPLSAAEIESNAQLARAREAARMRDEGAMVRPTQMIRELGDIASMYGVPGLESAADTAATQAEAIGGGNIEYDPEALGAGATMGLGDEGAAAIEHFRTGMPYREAQVRAEQRFDDARNRSPASAMLGTLGMGLATAPFAGEVTAARGAGVGAGLGAAGGYLGSEGESADQRALATLRGGAIGAAEGGLSAGLMRGGRQFAEVAAPSFMRTVGRGVAGLTAEGAGAGAGMGALESGGRIGSQEQLRDIGRSGVSGAAFGVPAGLASGVLRGIAGRRGAPGLADDLLATDLDETALTPGSSDAQIPADLAALGETEDPQFFRSLFSGGSPAEIAAQRVRAAGAMDRGVVNRVAAAFGGGERGLIRAAEVARRSGISPPGRPSTLGQSGQRAARVRDTTRNELAAFHREIGDTGAVMRGERMAAPLEAEARRLRALAVDDPNVEMRIGVLGDLADDLRFGKRGMPQRAEYESLLAQDLADPAEIGLRRLPDDVDSLPDLPGMEREVVAPLVRDAVQAQRLPYQAGRDVEREVADMLALYDSPNPPAHTSPQSVLERAHRSIVGERQAAGRAALGSRYETELMPRNEAFRLAMTIAPDSGKVPNYLLRNEGLLRGSGARIAGGGGPLGVASGFVERAYTQAEPSINAMLAERLAAAPSARLGNFAERLRLAAPSVSALSPAITSAQVGSSDASEQARRTAGMDRAADVGANWEPTPELLDEIDRQGLDDIDIDPELLDEIDRQGL